MNYILIASNSNMQRHVPRHAVATVRSSGLGEGHGTNTHREANEESLYNAKPSLRGESVQNDSQAESGE